MSYRAEVDHGLCTGYTECSRIAPNAFRLNADNQSEPIDSPADTTDDALLTAAQSCPTNAIRILAEDASVVYESG